MRSDTTLRSAAPAAVVVLVLMLGACSGDDDAGVVADPTTLDQLTDDGQMATDPATGSSEDLGVPVTEIPDSAPDEATDAAPVDGAATAGGADPAAVVPDEDPQVEAGPATQTEGVLPSEVVDGDGFMITFPVAPSVETVEVPLADGQTTRATIYQAQVDGSFVGFSFADTPEAPAEDFDVETALRDSAQGAADNTGGTVAEATIVDVQGRTAIDYLVTVDGGAIRGIAFFEGTRLYTGQQVSPGEAGGRDLLDALMATLTLG